MNYTRTSTLCGPPGCMKKQTRGPVAYPGNKGFITAKQASFNVGDNMSTLNKYAAAARCIRRQRVLKENAAAYIKQAAEEDTASQEAKKRRRSRLLRGLGIGAGLAGLGGLAYYYLKKHPELTWKYRSDASKEKYIDKVLATPLPGDSKPGVWASIRTSSKDPNASTTWQDAVTRPALDKMGLGFPWLSSRDEYGHGGIASDVYSLADDAWDFLTAPETRANLAELRRVNDMFGSTFKQRAADAEKYSPNNPDTAEERERSKRRGRDGLEVSTMWRHIYNDDADDRETQSSYNEHERMIDYEGLNTPRYAPGSYYHHPNADYVPVVQFSPDKTFGIEAIRAREAAELEAFKKKYPEQFQEQNDHD